MPLRWTFRKSKKIVPGLRATISRSGPSLSFGPRGAKVSISKRGVQTRASRSKKGCGLFVLPLLLLMVTIFISRV